ncbi:MAG: hypothetical protein GY771_13485 [bacterium]|nr:hypothetical protein [bacterium]
MTVLASFTAAETFRYFDYETGEEITEGDTHTTTYTIKIYDDGDNITSESYFEPGGKPISSKDRFHRIEKEYDERGWVTATRKYDTNGEPIKPGPLPKYFTRVTYDEFGNKNSRAFFTYDGEATVNNSGVHREVEEFIGKEKSISKSYFGIDGEPVAGFGDIHRFETEYDENGFECAYSYFGTSNEPTNYPRRNYRRLEEDSDITGRILERRYYGADGKPINRKESEDVFKIVYTYNGGGDDITSESVYDINGQPTTKDKWRVSFLDIFNPYSIDDLGLSDEGRRAEGAHKVEVTYNSQHQEESVDFFGVDGNPVADGYGVQHYEFGWDDSDRIGRVICVNYDGGLISRKWQGYVRIEIDNDSSDGITGKCVYGKDGESLALENGVHRVEYIWLDDEKTEVKCYDIKGDETDGKFRLR